jgi:outer membrane protein insertion porin family
MNLKKLSILTIFVLLICPWSALAEEESNLVTEVEIKGNKTVSTATINSQIRTQIGRPLSSNLLSEDLKRLYGLGYFSDVKIEQDKTSLGLKVVFTVTEKAVLNKIVIRGENEIRKNDIKKRISSSLGDYIDEQKIRSDVNSIQALYEEKGFYDATVTYRLDADPIANQSSLTVEIDEGNKVKIIKIDFEGVTAVEQKDILRKMQTHKAGWFRSGLLKDEDLDADLQRIRMLYDEKGYSDTKVTYRLEKMDTKPGEMRLTIEVNEGQQYVVGDVDIKGNSVFSSEEIIEKIQMQPLQPFSRRGLRRSVTNIQDLYFEKGYMSAKVLFDSVYNEKTQNVDTMYTITENNVTLVNRVRIEGNSKTKDIVIRRELRTYPGEPFNGAELRRSKERLFNLGYFEEVRFDVEDTSTANLKDLVVRVKETKTGEFSFGGGFSSIDKVLGFAQIRQRNFDIEKFPTFTGGGQDGLLRFELSEIRTNGELSWTDPWFMGNPFTLGFDLYRREVNRTRSSGIFFDEKRIGGAVRFGKEIAEYDNLSLTYRFETIEIEDVPSDSSADVRAEEGENDISSFTVGYSHDTRNNRFVPSSGLLLSGSAQLAGGPLAGDKDFWKIRGLAATYFKIFETQVLELKVRGGVADGFEDTDRVPIYERFFVGGANSVRGYRERRIGPRDAGTDDPIGGEIFWVANAEYTFPIYPNILKGAFFYDVGAAYLEDGLVGDGDIASGAGFGMRIKTPIGPVKLDMGYPLDDLSGEDKELRFHFNISQGF